MLTSSELQRIHAINLEVSVCQAVRAGRAAELSTLFSPKELDGVRNLKKALANGADRIVIGSASTAFPGWLSTDYPLVNMLMHERLGAVFPPDSIREVLAEHVFEHFTIAQAVRGLCVGYSFGSLCISCNFCFTFVQYIHLCDLVRDLVSG